MLLPCLFACLAHATALATESPSFADRLDKLVEKLDKLNVQTGKLPPQLPKNDLYAKLDRLNSITPDRLELNADDEEVLSAMQVWGNLNADQLAGVMRNLQAVRDDERNDRLFDTDDADDWNDEELQYLSEGDYAMDGSEDYDADDEPDTSTARDRPVTPSSWIRMDRFRSTVLSAVDILAATNDRPRILNETISASEKAYYYSVVANNARSVMRSEKCLTPQARWLSIRQMAPSVDTLYIPPCVQLHRCAPDSGCCSNLTEVAAPVDGKYVAVPLLLQKALGSPSLARMQFFNHTRCACVARDTLQATVTERYQDEDIRIQPDRQSDWQAPATEEPVLVTEATAPPQMKRCTCPTYFLARITDGQCTCVCAWHEAARRRDCFSLARGREHFGMKDRVCIDTGDCNRPTCDYGSYERIRGRCPMRKFRRLRYQRMRVDRN